MRTAAASRRKFTHKVPIRVSCGNYFADLREGDATLCKWPGLTKQLVVSNQRRARRAFRRFELSFAELLLYNMRHVQHHAGQLNLMLRQETDSAPGWVCAAEG